LCYNIKSSGALSISVRVYLKCGHTEAPPTCSLGGDIDGGGGDTEVTTGVCPELKEVSLSRTEALENASVSHPSHYPPARGRDGGRGVKFDRLYCSNCHAIST